mgnify:CR=1 FL=1
MLVLSSEQKRRRWLMLGVVASAYVLSFFQRFAPAGIAQDLAAAFQIRSIPTIAVIREGVMVFRESGALPASALNQVIDGVRGLDMDQVRAEIAEQQAQGGQQQG